MKLFVCIFDDARLLKHLLKHYDRFGIKEFHVAAPPHLAAYVTEVSEGYIVRQYNEFDVDDSFTGGVQAVTKMRELSQVADEWVVIVDLDEFVQFEESITDILGKVEAENGNIVQGIMYDRFAIDGQPRQFDDESDLPSLFPVKARFTKEVMKGVDIKGVLVKGHLRSCGAHHSFEGEKPYSKVLEIAHYKWTDRCLGRVRLAHDLCLAAGRGWAVQYKRILDHYETQGRFAWETFGGEIARTSSGIHPSFALEPRKSADLVAWPEYRSHYETHRPEPLGDIKLAVS